ncbi:hypothetical protein COMNV_01701 [Commensalibacter sp. Nvir]|uniref:SDR family NAD(P)-dependent oxidoreductase n=1 Tax=Commensalibacter sp. Nvir TaxID=3069817 RepID=UPI002D258AF5|nr:hypothetical protein COMNV_01701 [Commensalibacter sp. Nvir]
MFKVFNPKSILITGASSGIGKALALYYAKSGVTLFLWGQSEKRLQETKKYCERIGATVFICALNLSIPSNALEKLNEILAHTFLDLVILAAGSGDIKNQKYILEEPSQIFYMAQLNYVTPCLMATEIANQMIQKKINGRIVFLGSVAGFHSLPFASAYCSSKAGLWRFAQSLHLSLKKHNVSVTLITPGFIDTPLSQRLECNKLGMLKLEKAIQRITKAIETNKRELIIPKFFILLKWIDLLSPNWLKDYIFLHLKVKQNDRVL